ncbi:2-amino-4-hydroxy-6-hydroxymethyldihydropteridine diphosphokinase [Longivirga aurantiaca]|uniref:2-amino-4-hydroxy-6-hydroxymethyldihydropteridine diphosphokinase n=1 Tax=Longivirga aurantiaca TaxID=1837743 RepID=A0ABW1SYH8_9ACTN
MTRVALGLGANLGDRLAALQGAVDLIAPLLADAVVSAVYETAPVGGPADQPDYANAVLAGDTDLDPHRLLLAAHDAEEAWRRTREVRWGPRTLDVDVLAVGDLELHDPDLVLPHPRAHERGFVLVPWAEIDPGFVIAGHGLVSDLAARATERDGVDAVRRRTDVRLELPA